MTTLYLCAAGNPEAVRLALAVNRAGHHWDRIVLLDDDPAKHGQEILGVPVAGPFAALADHRDGDQAVNVVARSCKGRAGAQNKIESFGIPLVSLVHPSVDLGGSTLGRAVTIYAGCTISAHATVGDHAIVFTQAVLGHGASLGAGSVLAPGAVINARVLVGDLAYVGSNASVLPDLKIGTGATIGACSSVLFDVPADSTALGVPAEIMSAPKHVSPQAAGHNQRSEPDMDVRDFLDEVKAIYAEFLGVPTIGKDDNFFNAGGSSLLALKMQVSLQDRLKVPVTIVDIFRFPCPGQLAAHLAGGATIPPRLSLAAKRRRRHQAHS